MTMDWARLCVDFPLVPAGFKIVPGGSAAECGGLNYGQRPVLALAFSDDSSRLAVAGGGMIPGAADINVYDLESMRLTHVCRYHSMGIHDLAFSPGGLLASASHDYSVVLWNLDESDALFLVGGEDAGGSRNRVVFQGDSLFVGDGMTWADEQAALRRFDLREGTSEEVAVFQGDQGVANLALSPEGDTLVLAVEEMRSPGPPVRMIRIAPGSSSPLEFSFTRPVYDIAALPAGTMAVVGTSEDDEATCLWRLNAEGAMAGTWPLGGDISGSLAVSPDGGSFAVGYHHEVTIRDSDAFSARRVIKLGEDHVTAVAWSPNAKLLAVGTLERTVRVFEAETGQELPGHGLASIRP